MDASEPRRLHSDEVGYSRMCSLHFKSRDFVQNSTELKSTRRRDRLYALVNMASGLFDDFQRLMLYLLFSRMLPSICQWLVPLDDPLSMLLPPVDSSKTLKDVILWNSHFVLVTTFQLWLWQNLRQTVNRINCSWWIHIDYQRLFVVDMLVASRQWHDGIHHVLYRHQPRPYCNCNSQFGRWCGSCFPIRRLVHRPNYSWWCIASWRQLLHHGTWPQDFSDKTSLQLFDQKILRKTGQTPH